MKKTLILGASNKPERYAYQALVLLKMKGYQIVGISNKAFKVEGIEIFDYPKIFEGVDTITVYLSAKNQVSFYEYILELKPKRVIFNPGAENLELQLLANNSDIHTENACTLVLLKTGQY